ncbi:hypothetical protein [Hymenobacter lucidus]|uniref:Uncharacterized protein n=1 Tax=Hymenobacter lucidus TaxID=2880930 RepID=A0ABS8ANW5_9BACT|nr:hypothetical protein [Hymenobacter lucidus]MCB2407449.1 hypothetical protein [Hymenobacter lucidus]
MRTATFRQSFAFVFVVLMVCSSLGAMAGTPYQRALRQGRRYVHRPIYKQYQRPAHRSSRTFSLFGR